MAGAVPEIEPDLLPPTGQTVAGMMGLGDKYKNEDGDEAPKTRRSSRARKSTSKGRSGPTTIDATSLAEELAEAYAFLGFMLLPVSPNGAQALAENGPRCAEAWVRQAEKSPRIAKFLTGITEGSGWITLAMAHAPIAMAIVGDVKAGPVIMEPETMEQQVQQFMQANDGMAPQTETVG